MKPFVERVPELAEERGIKIQQLIHEASSYEEGAAKPDTVKSHIYGRRPASLVVMRQVAAVLDVDPAKEFVEFSALETIARAKQARSGAVAAAERGAQRRGSSTRRDPGDRRDSPGSDQAA